MIDEYEIEADGAQWSYGGSDSKLSEHKDARKGGVLDEEGLRGVMDDG